MAKLDFSQLKSKKMSKRDINMILCAIAFLGLIASYLLGFTSIKEKNAELDKQLEERGAYLAQLQEYFENLAMYESEIDKAKVSISANIDRLPRGQQNEDYLLWLMHTNEKIGCSMTTVSFGSVDLISQFNTFIDGQYVEVFGYRQSGSISMNLSYDLFKKYINNLYDQNNEYAYLDSASLTYNAESEELSTVLNLSKFFITYEGYTYTPQPGYDVPLGKTNPFGSK